MFVLFSCEKKVVTTGSIQSLFEVNVDPNYLLGQKTWIVFSDLNGEIVEFGELDEAGIFNYEIETNLGNKFHATIVTHSISQEDEGIFESVRLKTYAFLDGEVTLLNLRATESDTESLLDSALTLEVGFNVQEGEIKESVLSGTLTGAKNTNNYGAVKVKEGQETVFTYVHLNGENNWRMKFLENVEDNSSIMIDIVEMEELPTQIVQVPNGYDVEFATRGIISCEDNYAHSLQWFSQAENGNIESRYLPESNSLFAHYKTDIKLKTDDEVYQNIRIGEPITAYAPIEIDFKIKKKDIDNFKLSTSADAFTLYKIKYNSYNSNSSGSSDWTIYGNFTDTFVAPDLTELLLQDANWFDKTKLELDEVKEYNYSVFPSYNEWLQFEFNPELTNELCISKGLSIGEQITSRSIVFD